MKREPLFNIPTVIVVLSAALAAIHGVRTVLLSEEQDIWVLLYLAFIPARYDSSMVLGGVLPGGLGAEIWTFVTYSLLHGSWMHLIVNGVWLLAFGSALARRFGTARFLAFFAVTAAAGAAMHLLTNAGSPAPMIGASASISGAMAAAMRFAFQRGGPLGLGGGADESFRVPAIPLTAVFSDARVLAFLAVWFGINILFGLGSHSITGGDEIVAWQAHIGGFLAGLLLFSWFDPKQDVPPSIADDPTLH
ncbi:MAG: rhomboid family intramembrane serine protease [Pseudolabrys sp.]|nr:rhomboid family intramembrane serine protease [Pseudolabrys sp.]MDP2298875.1 rhomboid family intramembrane serine protease [Pseudolabrys sp.]